MISMTLELSKNRIKFWENSSVNPITFFYTDRDKEGRILMNIGFGEHHDSWEAYRDLINTTPINFNYKDPFKYGPVSLEEIKADFDLVKRGGLLKPEAERQTQTRADPIGLNKLFDKSYANHEELARAWYNSVARNEVTTDPTIIFPEFDKLPPNAHYALVDLAYNIKATSLLQYVSLKKAIKRGDWETAANNCTVTVPRGMDGLRRRNEERQDMFRSIQSLQPVIGTPNEYRDGPRTMFA